MPGRKKKARDKDGNFNLKEKSCRGICMFFPLKSNADGH